MKIFLGRPDACAVRKSVTYLVGMILWLIVTVMLVSGETPENDLSLHSLLLVKMGLVGTVFLGRELLFSRYQRPRWLVLIWGLGWLLFFGGQLFRLQDGNIFLSVLDTLIWSLLPALFLEVLLVLFLTWTRIPQMSPVQIGQLWEQCWRNIVCLGLWMTFAISFFYFYLIQFYLVDILFYRNLFLILVAGLGFSLFASLAYRINRWLAKEVKDIDHQLEPVFQWREFQTDDGAQWLSHYQGWLLIRGYLLSFRRPRICLKKIFYYLLLLAWLHGLPYIFGAML